MNASTPTLSHDQSTDLGHALGSSTSKWYAEWKQKKTAVRSAATAPQAPPADDAADGLAKWLSGDVK
jgi:hypothetical protein